MVRAKLRGITVGLRLGRIRLAMRVDKRRSSSEGTGLTDTPAATITAIQSRLHIWTPPPVASNEARVSMKTAGIAEADWLMTRASIPQFFELGAFHPPGKSLSIYKL